MINTKPGFVEKRLELQDKELRRVTKKASILEQDNFKLISTVENLSGLLKRAQPCITDNHELWSAIEEYLNKNKYKK